MTENLESQIFPISEFQFTNPLDQLEAGLDLVNCVYEGLDAEHCPGQVKTLEIGLQFLRDARDNLAAARYVPR